MDALPYGRATAPPFVLALALKPGRARQQLSQHIRQDSTVQVVVDLDRRVDAQSHWNILRRSIRAMNRERHIHAWRDFKIIARAVGVVIGGLQSRDVERLSAVEIQRRRVRSFLELTRQDPHADKVAAMNAFEALRYYRLHPQEPKSPSRPRRPGGSSL